jgi:hypothetical protein
MGGDFVGFGHVVDGEKEIGGRAATVDALDLQSSERDSVLGRKLNVLALLPNGLENVSIAISMGHFAAIAEARAEEIAKARDDTKNTLLIALYLYEAYRWIYGDGAFGLRFIAWIARKAPEPVIDGMTLVMFRLRQVPGAMLPSDKIAEMAEAARKVCLYSKRLEWHWRNHPRFSKILHPKRIKLALADEIELKRWQSELNAIILQATKTPTVSNDGQEVGKSH